MQWTRACYLGAALALITIPAAAGQADTSYKAMVAAAEAGQAGVDYGKLRGAYVHSAGYDPYGMAVSNLVDRMRKAYAAGDCKLAAKDAAAISAQQFTNVEAHLAAALCFEKSGNKAGAGRQHEIFLGLTGSILESGDGLTPATAFHVVSLDEEYFVLTALGLNVGEQALVQLGGHAYDRFAVSAKDFDAKSTLYFEIDPILGAAKQRPQ